MGQCAEMPKLLQENLLASRRLLQLPIQVSGSLCDYQIASVRALFASKLLIANYSPLAGHNNESGILTTITGNRDLALMTLVPSIGQSLQGRLSEVEVRYSFRGKHVTKTDEFAWRILTANGRNNTYSRSSGAPGMSGLQFGVPAHQVH